MNYLQRIKTRIGEEGCRKTFKYGALVGIDGIKGYLRDSYIDLRYSGCVLHGNQTSQFKHLGANDVYHTNYAAMPLIFHHVTVGPSDVLVDVGCGKGRVINYWLKQHYPNKIIGLELDPAIAAATARQFANRPNVEIIVGDAIANLPPEGTIFYFYNPFSEENVRRFEQSLAKLGAEKKITLVYYNPKSLPVFAQPTWEVQKIDFQKDFNIQRWGRLNKYHELALITSQPGGV